MSSSPSRSTQAHQLMLAGQSKLIEAFEALEIAKASAARFESHEWLREQLGGGKAKVIERGAIFERAGVNVSAVRGKRVPPSLAAQHPGSEGKPYFATGISMVLHPQNPYVPSFHANYRYFEIGDEADGLFWFGGGADLTPNYAFEEDIRHFHHSLKAQCDRHDTSTAQSLYPRLKTTCDTYFYLKHRKEMRGIGGIFFDEFEVPGEGDFARGLAFAKDGIDTILAAYLPIIQKRQDSPFGEREREWQLYRRGRYVEFNLIYDRGTLFGLQTGGNIEAILMSMPLYAHWRFDYQPEVGSPEAAMLDYLQPRDWV
ncbi:MAG: oxygen-dependent coproporphyrinogen oxidase [Deinococcales bacterium]